MHELIKAKVAKILSSREIVITAGSNQGVCIGMHFDVLDPKGEDITDPDSGEILGSIQRPKVRLKITQVQEAIAVASTYKKTKINIGGTASSAFSTDFSASLTRSLMPPKFITKYETLKTNQDTWDDLAGEESFVKTGDPVIQVAKEAVE